MYYVTVYKEYPIYEPAEGGYYYTGKDMVFSVPCQTRLAAYNAATKLAAEYEFEPDTCRRRGEYREYGRYIGEGRAITIERKRGSQIQGWKPYQ